MPAFIHNRPGSVPWLAAVVLLCAGGLACGADGAGPDTPDPPPPEVRPALEGSWTAGPSLPVGLERPAVAVAGGFIHVVGGARGQLGSDEQTTPESFVLDLGGEVGWIRGVDYPVDAMDIALTAVGDTLWGVGGLAFPGKRWERFFRLAPGATAWERLPQEGGPRGPLAGAWAGGRLVVMDLEGSGSVWRYGGVREGWSEGRSRPLPRRDFAVVSDGERVWAVFGQNPQTSILEAMFIDEYDPEADAWRRLTTAPASRGRVAAAWLNGRIHVLGGFDSSFRATAMHMAYEPATDTWYDAPELPAPRVGLRTVVVDGALLVLGGGLPGADEELRREAWIFSPASG